MIVYGLNVDINDVVFRRLSNLLETIIINPPEEDNERVAKKSAPWTSVHRSAILSDIGRLKRVSLSTAITFKSRKINNKPRMK